MKNSVKYGLAAFILVLIGVIAGFKLKDTLPRKKVFEINSGFEKFESAVWYIEENYVSEPENQSMIDDAIKGILEGLDPHSIYIPATEMALMDEQMQGSFDGIGIEFNIIEDTLYVITTVSGGPSEVAGLLAGDKIIKVDGKNFAGIGLENSVVLNTLKGPSGSDVKVSVKRAGSPNLLDYTITRGKIPLYSVDYSYMIRPHIGYLKLSRFSDTTYDEFHEHMERLKRNDMQDLILDLRGNPGGYMHMAQWIADDFLKKDKLVVYTDGRKPDANSKYYATSDFSLFEEGGLVILIDYGSASASEIVSGAVQDHDRGLVVGTRSFGKGLVQQQEKFEDGSAIRLVVSKYYTPSGRCIQKPYDKTSEEYDLEILERFQSGEIYDASKIEFPDSLSYKTAAGRTVYGGGGIMPDFFIPPDTNGNSAYLSNLFYKNLFRQFAFRYVDDHPELEKRYLKPGNFRRRFIINDQLRSEFIRFAENKGVPYDESGFNISFSIIQNYLRAFIARRIWNDEGFYPIFHEEDRVLQEAIKLMPKARRLSETGQLAIN